MKTLILVATLLLTANSFANPLNKEFQILPKNSIQSQFLGQQTIIHETNDSYILSSPLTNFESYDYYYVQLPENKKSHPWFLENANVIEKHGDEFLIVEVRNEKQLLDLAGHAHHEGGACGMIQKLTPQPIALVKQSAPLLVRQKSAEVSGAVSLVDGDKILSTMDEMISWGTRFEGNSEGVDTGEKLKELYEKLIPSDRNDVEIELVSHNRTDQKSIVVRIKGSTTPEKLVLLGSHIDSINRNDNTDAPGADDNASGTSTNMEVFRVLMQSQFKPASTIEIHGYAAEEIGLVGSKDLAAKYKNSGKQVIAMVQFDMNGYAKDGDEKITFVSNSTDGSLTSQLKDLVSLYNDIPSASGFMIFGSSDHAAWNDQGFPVAFPTENPFGFNRKIHTKDDTMEQINSPRQIKEFGKLGVAYLMSFSM